MLAVQPRRGGQTHITSLRSPGRTACGRKADGYIICHIEHQHVSCLRCKAAVFYKVKR